MLAGLLALNIVVWLAVLAYLCLTPLLKRRPNVWVGSAGVAAALALSVGSYLYVPIQRKQEAVQKHYWAGIEERNRGNLAEAEKHFDQVVSLQPGNEDARRQLAEIRDQRPAQEREQRRDARVESVPALQPPPNAPANTPAAQNAPAAAPPPTPGKPGEKPKPVFHKVSPFEINHYALDVNLNPAEHSLDATAVIRVRSRGDTVPRLDFSLNPEFKPSLVQVDGTSVPFSHTNDLLSVNPPAALAPGRTATVTVKYARTGKALVKNGEALISKEGTYFLSESRWYPATGELDFRSPVRVRATVPKGFTVVSVGALKGKETDGKTVTFHWETDRFASMVSLAAAPYVQQSVSVPPVAGGRGPLNITCYTFPAHKDRAAHFLKEASAITRFYERLLGPYPYEKLAVVEIPLFPGGYGTTSFVMLIDQSFAEKKLDREFLAHEIAHQWWGNSVFPQGMGAAWLTEAFANYCAWMYDASVNGNPRLLQKRVAKATRDYFEAVGRKGDQAIVETDPYLQVGASQQIIYEKGAVVLHMLRHQVGDAAFKRILRQFATQYRFGKAKIEDFRALAERESGQQLGWFFDQWLGRAGGPSLTYAFRTEPESAAQNRGVLSITQAAPAYRARLKVVLDVENSVQTRIVELTQEQQEFTFPVKGKITSVLLDPENWYLMHPPRWNPG